MASLKETILNELSKYSSREEARKYDRKNYHLAQRHRLLNIAFPRKKAIKQCGIYYLTGTGGVVLYIGSTASDIHEEVRRLKEESHMCFIGYRYYLIQNDSDRMVWHLLLSNKLRPKYNINVGTLPSTLLEGCTNVPSILGKKYKGTL